MLLDELISHFLFDNYTRVHIYAYAVAQTVQWCPPKLPDRNIYMLELPHELILGIIKSLDHKYQKWHFAMAFPQILDLVSPLLGGVPF